MQIENQNELLRNCRYKICCKYKEEELIDGYKDRKALIRYKKAILGTISIFLMSIFKTILFSRSMYFTHIVWYKSCIFWILCALGFMIIFTGNNDKFMWNSMPERTYSPQTSTYELYLCENFLVLFYNITGVTKVIEYNKLKMFEVNNYFLLEPQYLNGYYISKEKLGEYETNNVREFLKTKGKVNNLKLPFIFSKFARMHFRTEIIIIAMLACILGIKIHTNNSTPAAIGDMVICNNLGITVTDANTISYENADSEQLLTVSLSLKSFKVDDGENKEYSPFDFKIVSEDGDEYNSYNLLQPSQLKMGSLGHEENVTGDIYFFLPGDEKPKYLFYSTYDLDRHKRFSEKILLKKSSKEQ